jgi:TRAP-type C4-dicarboxylate transport system permease small subunit
LLNPLLAAFLLIAMIYCGKVFRQNWVSQGPGWVKRAWIYGSLAFLFFVIVAFVPLDMPN